MHGCALLREGRARVCIHHYEGQTLMRAANWIWLLQIRESIKSLFPNRDCFALVRPMSDESQLQRLETVPVTQLRPEFREVRLLLVVPLPFACTAPPLLVHLPSFHRPFTCLECTSPRIGSVFEP